MGKGKKKSIGERLFPNRIVRKVAEDVTRPIWGDYGRTNLTAAKKHMKKVRTDKYDPLK